MFYGEENGHGRPDWKYILAPCCTENLAIEVQFYLQKWQICVFSYSLDLGVMYALHLELDTKLVVDFLFVIIALHSLAFLQHIWTSCERGGDVPVLRLCLLLGSWHTWTDHARVCSRLTGWLERVRSLLVHPEAARQYVPEKLDVNWHTHAAVTI